MSGQKLCCPEFLRLVRTLLRFLQKKYTKMNGKGLNDDINVVELAIAVYRYVRKQFMLFSVFLFFGLLAGLGVYMVKDARFSTEMLANSPVMNNRMTSIFNNLALLVEDRQYHALARELNVPVSVAENLVAISAARNEIEDEKEEGSELLSFTVRITLSDTSSVNELQKAMISYISNNDFVRSKIDLRRRLIEKLIVKIDEETAELDSLQQLALQPKNAGQVQLYVSKSSQNDLVDLLTEKNRLLEVLQETQAVNVIHPFGIYSIEKTSWIILMASFGFVFLCLGILRSLFLELRNLAKSET